jgi:ElaB/YqjD/DUF883 family membrane-anchored ribosome-binding protein
MPSADEQLPEGTDAIIEGAGASEAGNGETARPTKKNEAPVSAMPPAESDAKGVFFERIDELRGQAGDRARDLAQTGKERATAALDSLVQTVEDAAADIDEKLGNQYGDYARRAAQYIGNFSDSFRDKDVDDLFNDAREFVKKSPAVAIGAAAALGFVVARLARSSMPESPGDNAPKA